MSDNIGNERGMKAIPWTSTHDKELQAPRKLSEMKPMIPHGWAMGIQHVHKQLALQESVAHMGAHWVHHHCRIGGPQRYGAGSKIRSGPHMGALGTSPLL